MILKKKKEITLRFQFTYKETRLLRLPIAGGSDPTRDASFSSLTCTPPTNQY